MPGNHGTSVLASDRQTRAGQMTRSMFEHILARAVHDRQIHTDFRDQQFTHRVQPVDGQLAPVFVVALEVSPDLSIKNRFADLRLSRLVKSLVVFDR